MKSHKDFNSEDMEEESPKLKKDRILNQQESILERMLDENPNFKRELIKLLLSSPEMLKEVLSSPEVINDDASLGRFVLLNVLEQAKHSNVTKDNIIPSNLDLEAQVFFHETTQVPSKGRFMPRLGDAPDGGFEPTQIEECVEVVINVGPFGSTTRRVCTTYKKPPQSGGGGRDAGTKEIPYYLAP